MKVNPPVRRTQAERTAATRAVLITAARELFATKGFSEVSTQAIGEAAGVTRGALYHQFADKTELFAAVYEDVEKGIVTEAATRIVAAKPDGALEAMRLGARLFLDVCAAPEVAQIVLIDAPSVLGWERWRAVGVKYGLGVIETMLTQAISEGSVPQQPVRASAHVLLSALDEAALYVSRAEDPHLARAEMYAVCDRLIAGIAAP
jgi:AcrR family transcriptional regulator